MVRLLQSGWMTMLVGTLSYLATTFVLLDPVKIFSGRQLSRPVSNSRVIGTSWQFFDPEVDQLIEELTAKKEKIEKRERELEELARRLETERAEISTITQAVVSAQQQFDRAIVRVKQEEAGNLKRLAKTYATMTPEIVSSVLGEMEDEQIVRILMFMKEQEVAVVLEALAKGGENQVKRVAALSDRLRTSLAKKNETP